MSLSSIHLCHGRRGLFSFFFFNDTATTEIYTLSLHDALPIYLARLARDAPRTATLRVEPPPKALETRLRQSLDPEGDRKSTRLNSSHSQISYAVFCLKKKNDGPPYSTPTI